jgi:hypothetical protein
MEETLFCYSALIKSSHSTFGVSKRRLEAPKERKKQAISSKQHLYGTQSGRHHRGAARGEIGIPPQQKESISTHLQTPPLQAPLVMICTRHSC